MTEIGPEGPVAKELKGAKAELMAELALIHNDLTACTRQLRLLRDEITVDAGAVEETVIRDALFRDSINLFVGCFEKRGLDVETVFGSDDGGVEFFRWAKDVRDSYAAHRFGPARQAVAAVFVDPNTGLAVGVGPFHMQWTAPDGETLDQLLRAVAIAGRYAAQRGSDLNDELLGETTAMTAADLAALPPARLHVPGSEELRMGRASFRALKSGDGPAKPSDRGSTGRRR